MITQSTHTPMYDDAYLDACGDEYVELGLAGTEVTLLAFLAEPETYRQDPRFLPLLPQQRQVQERLDAEAEQAEREARRAYPDTRCRGGALVDPLHHHSRHRRGPAANFARRARRGEAGNA